MSKTAHTPGPWKVRNTRDVFCGTKRVCSVNAANKEPLSIGDEMDVAEANARLIAAAPRLLAALKATKATLERVNQERGGPIVDTIWHGPGETLFDFIDAAIHEAEGEQ